MKEIDLEKEFPLLGKKRTLVRRHAGTTRWAAETLLRIIAMDIEKHHDLVPSYIMTLCSNIEARVNNNIVDFFFKKTGAEYRQHSKPYMLLPFERKLSIVIPLISNYKYKINLKSADLKAVSSLFELRNRMVHRSDEYVDGYQLEYERFRDFEILDKERLKSYSNSGFKDQSLKDLENHFELHLRINEKFYELFPRINYKRFDPGNWFTPINPNT